MPKLISNQRLRQVSDLTFQMVINANITSAPVDIEAIAKRCGISVEQTDLGEDISGVLVVRGENATIAYSSNQGDQRKRFTIAHEIGHYALHRNLENDTVFVDRDFIVKYRSNKIYSEVEMRQEREANAFAASLLMPKEFIYEELNKESIKYLTETDVIVELARVFNVSIPAMTFRLTNLNILY